MIKLPEEFVSNIKEILPQEEIEAFLKSYEKTPKKGIRTNLLKTTPEELKEVLPEEFKAEPIPWCRAGFYIDHESRPGKKPEYYTGLYYPQEPSAMIPGESLNIEEGDLVLDLCAAPGGKSTQLAGRLGEKGTLVLNEIVKSRVGVLASNVERMGIKNALILNENPARLVKNFKESFDKILVDAPCSGEGMFRKDNKVIDEWDKDRPDKSRTRQLKILETVDKLLKPGGELVYSTCTFSPKENEKVIESFLNEYGYSLEPVNLKGINKSNLKLDISPEILEKTVRIWPHLNEGEGHFIARLKKNGEPKRRKKKVKAKSNLKKLKGPELKTFKEFERTYLTNFNSENLYIFRDKLLKLPEGISPEMLENIKVVSAGLEIGEFKKNRFEPSHTLAMSLKKNEFSNIYELSEDELWEYLKGMEIKPGEEIKNGWVLLTYNGNPVGFGKNSGVIKNKYPRGLRIYKK